MALKDLPLDEVMEAISITAERKRTAYPNAQCRYLSGVLRNMRLRRKCSPDLFRVIERLRLYGCQSLRTKDGRITWDGPDLTPELSAEVQAHFDELLAVL